MKIISMTILLCLVCSICWTAEIIIKIGDSPNSSGFKDGDIIEAFNDVDIKKIYAQHIVHVKNMPRNADGLLEVGCLLDMYLSKVSELKIERISESEVRVTNLWTSDVEIRSKIPNAKGNYMNVPVFFKRRAEHPASKVFGVKGNEYVYGGGEKVDHATFDAIWTEIETKTLYRKKDFTMFPWNDSEMSKHLVIKTEDFSQEIKHELTSSEYDANENLVKKRTRKVDYKNIGLSQEILNNVADKAKKKDIRNLPNFPLSVVTVKP